MYGSDLVVGARTLGDLDAALRRALPEQGLSITRAFDAADTRARYDAMYTAGRETPSIAFGPLADGTFGVNVRGPRAPLWNNALAQRLSALLGGFAGCRVNDRNQDNYGYGWFLDGHPIEGGARTVATVVDRFGIDPRVTSSMFFAALDEDENARRFCAMLERMSGPYARAWPPRGAISVLAVEGEGSVPPIVPLPRSVVAVLAADVRDLDAWTELRLLEPTYDVRADGSLDEDLRPVLAVRARCSTLDLLAAVDRASACSAFVTDIETTWTRRAGEAFERLDGHGVAVLARAAEALPLPLLAVTFPRAVPGRPYR